MQAAEPDETFADLGGGHRGAIVTHRGSWSSMLHHHVRQAVRDVLGGLGQIPLLMTARRE